MADMTVIQLAKVVGIPVERLLNQLKEAGLSINNEQETVNEDQKRILLNYLKGGAGTTSAVAPDRITLRRKSISQVKLGHDVHTGKTVNIEVRKKKTYEKHTTIPEQPVEPEIEEQPELAIEAEVVVDTLVMDVVGTEVVADSAPETIETTETADSTEASTAESTDSLPSEISLDSLIEETQPEKVEKKKPVV